MHALTFSTAPELGHARGALEKLRAKWGSLAMVLAVHAALFYVACSGMMSRMVDAALPKAVLVTFVAATPPPTAPPPAAPKVMPLVQLPPPMLASVPEPVILNAPQADTITVTQSSVPAEPPTVQVATVNTPAAPVAAAASTPKTITSGVEYLQPPLPVYPPMSRRMGEQGRVMLRILVNEKGLPDQVQVHTSSGSARLDEAGRQAALRAQFKPHMEDGHAIAVYVIVPLNFQLSS